MANRRGVALIFALIITSLVMSLAVIMAKMVYNNYGTAVNLQRREEAFWLAEAGLAAGRSRVKQNPDWFTDLPHYPEDDSRWLKEGALGVVESLGDGEYKIVREKEQGRLYSVGRKGEARVVLKLEFETFPFRALNWAEI
jgi:hypothetical protein